MCEAWGVSDDGIRSKWDSSLQVCLDARFPAPIEHGIYHFPFCLDVARPHAAHTRYQAGILDHICHEFGRIAANGIEFQAMLSYEVFKHVVRCDAHTMPMLLKFIPNGDKRLYISSTSDHLDDDVESNNSPCYLFIFGRRCRRPRTFLLLRRWYEFGKGTTESRVQIDINPAVVYTGSVCIESRSLD